MAHVHACVYCVCRVGESVPFAKKGRFGVVHGSVQEHFNPYHLLIETGSKDDLTEEEMIKKVIHKPPH